MNKYYQKPFKKNLLVLLVLALLLMACEKKQHDKRLLGNWSSLIYQDPNEIQFYQDSLRLYEMGKEFYGTWHSKDHLIYATLLHRKENIVIDTFTLAYKFNKDTLLIKSAMDSSFLNPPLLKVTHRFEHLLRMLNMKIDLPKTNSALVSSGEGGFNLELYIGYIDDELKIKLYNRLIDLDKNDVLTAIFTLKSQHSEEDQDQLKFVLIADQSVSEAELDSIKSKLMLSPIKKAFRVYKSDSIDYVNLNWREHITWYGLME